MTLRDIIKDCGVIDVKGNLDIRITAVTDDSRKVSEGALFVAVKGHGADGHAFIAKAIEAGAAAVVYEEGQNEGSVTFVKVASSRHAVARLFPPCGRNYSRQFL